LRKFFDYFAAICIIRSLTSAHGAGDVEELGWKSGAFFFFAGNADASRHGSRIVEHDLDMVRSAERPRAGFRDDSHGYSIG